MTPTFDSVLLACCASFVSGVLAAVFVWWRPISRARHDGREYRRLRLERDEADAQLSAEIASGKRMGNLYIEEVAKRMRP